MVMEVSIAARAAVTAVSLAAIARRVLAAATRSRRTLAWSELTAAITAAWSADSRSSVSEREIRSDIDRAARRNAVESGLDDLYCSTRSAASWPRERRRSARSRRARRLSARTVAVSAAARPRFCAIATVSSARRPVSVSSWRMTVAGEAEVAAVTGAGTPASVAPAAATAAITSPAGHVRLEMPAMSGRDATGCRFQRSTGVGFGSFCQTSGLRRVCPTSIYSRPLVRVKIGTDQ